MSLTLVPVGPVRSYSCHAQQGKTANRDSRRGRAGARIVEIAGEKQPIVNPVTTQLGCHCPQMDIANGGATLAAAWTLGARDPIRDDMLEMLRSHLPRYAREA